MVGIISYLPENSNLREHRITCLIKVIEYWHNILPDVTIKVVAQCFTDNDVYRLVEITDRVTIYRLDKGVGPAKARNILLREFYGGTDGWIILSDDDVVLYDYYDPADLIRSVHSGEYDKYKMDIILTVSPQLRPFKEKLLKSDVSHYHLFTPGTLSDIPNLLIMRKTGIKIFYDENILDTGVPEDAHFLIRAMKDHRLKVVTCLNLIKKDLALYKSTLCEDETAKDTYWHKQLSANLREYIQKTYGVKMSQFSHTYNTAEPFRIERHTVYTLPENLAVVIKRGKTDPTQTLF